MRRGQSTVEWALMISVLAVAAVGAAYAFVPAFRDAMEDAGEGMAGLYTTGDVAEP